MVSRDAGKATSYRALPREAKTAEDGLSLADLTALAARHGLHLTGLRLSSLGELKTPRPWIANLCLNHYVVVERWAGDSLVVVDPRVGRISIGKGDLLRLWSGYALVPEP